MSYNLLPLEDTREKRFALNPSGRQMEPTDQLNGGEAVIPLRRSSESDFLYTPFPDRGNLSHR